MTNYALVKNGSVDSVVVWDDVPYTPATDDQAAQGWSPPDGYTAIALDEGSSVSTEWRYDGATFIAPSPPTPPALSLPQQATVLLLSGLTVVSTGTPALNGTYAIDQLSQMDIIAIETSLNAGKGFPGGATVFNYADTAGVMHSFTAANFTDFAAAVRDYVYALKSVIAGASTTVPSSTTTIA